MEEDGGTAWNLSRMLTANSEEFALNVLFICTGNICRSPSAERLAMAYASQRELTRFSASSAGIRALIGQPMHPYAISALKRFAGRADNFKARQFRPHMAANTDLILTMTKAHRDDVLALTPRHLSRTFTLSEASALAAHPDAHKLEDFAYLRPHINANRMVDVPDPIGKNEQFFEEVASMLVDLLRPFLDLCLRLPQ